MQLVLVISGLSKSLQEGIICKSTYQDRIDVSASYIASSSEE